MSTGMLRSSELSVATLHFVRQARTSDPPNLGSNRRRHESGSIRQLTTSGEAAKLGLAHEYGIHHCFVASSPLTGKWPHADGWQWEWLQQAATGLIDGKLDTTVGFQRVWWEVYDADAAINALC